jgi:hypothetical protein
LLKLRTTLGKLEGRLEIGMIDPTRLNDDDLRVALFDALVKRLDVKSLEDPSITVVNRMPSAFALSRRGNLLTVTQGIGLRLLRGDVKWKNRRAPRILTVERSTIQSRLALMPDRIVGTPDEILDRIVVTFLAWTATEEATGERLPDSPPTPPLARQQSRPSSRPVSEPGESTAPAPPPSPSIGRSPLPQRGMSARPPQERRPPSSPPIGDPRSVPVDVADSKQPPPPRADEPNGATAAPAHPAAPVRETPTRTLRTYQLLFETTHRQLSRAQAARSPDRYSLIGAGVFVALTAEAFFNDLGSRVIPSWSQLQRLDPREKAEVLSIELFNINVNWSIRPFQSIAQALGFRRALAHAHAETLSFDQVQTVESKGGEVPRTRQSVWQAHCDVTTIERWVTDVRLVIERFSRAHDPTEVAISMAEHSSVNPYDDPITRKNLRQRDTS